MHNSIISPGDFLLATPSLGSGYFKDSVIFIVECSEKNGCWGLVVNNPTHLPLDEVFKKSPNSSANLPPDDYISSRRQLYTFFFGGPVQNTDPFQKLSVCVLEVGFSVFNGATEVSKGIYITRPPLDMEIPVYKLIAPLNKTARIFFGYSGWGPGQLEREILDGAWEVLNPIPFDIFSADRDTVSIDANKFREYYENHRI